MRMVWMTMVLVLLAFSVRTNNDTVGMLNPENKLIIITLDGLRWQEVFSGADSSLLFNPLYTANTFQTGKTFWGSSAEERRKKLMPFFWTRIASQGELYGNRSKGNKMNVANPYALSYPGYNEMLTGRVDYTLFNNGEVANANRTVLDFLHETVAYNNQVAAFASWNVFPYILGQERAGYYINSGVSAAGPEVRGEEVHLANNEVTRDDKITYSLCKNYIRQKEPSVVLLSFGGTDEAAHRRQYDLYLKQAASADSMINDLWQYLQTMPSYAGKTTFLITTDHGRGTVPANWHTHGAFVAGSSQTWMALLGKGISNNGEQKMPAQYYQKNIRKLALKILSD